MTNNNSISSVNSIDSVNSASLIYDASLPSQLNDFLIHMDSVQKSMKTIGGYKIDIRLMFRFIKATRLGLTKTDLKTIDLTDIDDDFIKLIEYKELNNFMLYLKGKNNKENDRARKVSAIKSFFLYLVKKAKLISMRENPALELEKPKLEKRKPIFLDKEESNKLLDSVKNSLYWERDYCIIAMFLYHGLRVSELCNISLTDIKKGTIEIIGKGNKQRTTYLNAKSIKALDQWLVARDKKASRLIDEDSKNSLFFNKNYGRFNPQGIEKMVSKWVNVAGLSDKITPHKLRHTCATSYYTNGVDLLAISEMLGHSNISTTQIYTHVDSKRLRAVALINPYE